MQDFLNSFGSLSLEIIAAVLMIVLTAAFNALRAKTAIEVTEAQRNALHAVLMRAIESALTAGKPQDQVVAQAISYVKSTSPDLLKKATNNGKLDLKAAVETLTVNAIRNRRGK